MSSSTGTHKRNVQNKRNKGSTGNIAAGGISVRETPASKSHTDELIHVQKDVQFGDNWCKVAVFFAISSALLGVGYYALIGSNSNSNLAKDAPQFNWLSVLEEFGFYYNREVAEEPIDEEPSVEKQIETSYLDLLWSYYPFGQNDEPPSEAPIETEQIDESSKESENDKDSREDDSKESADDDKSQNDTDDDENDQDDRESEENLDDEKNSYGDDDEKDNDGDDDEKDNDDDDDQKENEDDSNSLDDSENVYEPFKSYHRYTYEKYDEGDLRKNAKDDDDEDDLQKDTKDDDDDDDEDDLQKDTKNDDNDVESSNESKEQIDRRDQRFNYYHSRDSEEVHKYNYIKGEDESNDSSEQGGSEKFDSEENTKSENYEDTKKSEDSSHSSEEVERDEFPDLKEVPEETEFRPKEDPPESGNLVTKLSVGIALIFVAYSVIIRKWNNYVNREPNEADIIFRVASENDEDLADIAQTIAENLLDSINDTNSLDETSEADNKTLQDYLETPSNSANEQSEDDSANEKITAERDLPMDSENSQTASETEGETDEDSDYEKGDYDRINVTNRDDWPYRHQLDEADEDWDRHNIMNATLKYWAILEQEPRSIRAQYGLVRSFDWKADVLRSNQALRNVIKLYKKLLKKRKIPEALQKIIAERTIDRMKFIGSYDEAIQLLKVMIEKYPEHISYQIDLGIIYLILDKLLHAEIVLGKVIQKDPDNGVALVNYGFIMKQKGELEKAVKVLSKGISSGVKDTQDSKFYYHLGEALQRLGRRDEALEFYQKAAEKGIFLSKYQRSLYNTVSLKAKPWWDPATITNYTNFFQNLESNWIRIRDEVKNMLANEKRNPFRDEAELLREKGEWKQLELFSRGKEQLICKKFPITCGLIREFAPAAECQRGQVKFSIIEPGTHVWPHCGPTNTRLRAHLGLIVPKNVTIRVAEETRSWREGKVLLFDDSFEHEIWHNGTSSRLVLIVDVWHPNLDKDLRKKLTPI